MLFRRDELSHRGLQDDLRDAEKEINTKRCFAPLREVLKNAGISDLGNTLSLLAEKASKTEIVNQLPPEIQDFYNEAAKKADNGRRWLPTPTQLKPVFVESLFKQLQHGDGNELNLSPEAYKQLKQALKSRLSEPSEVRATRAVFVNTLNKLDWNTLEQNQGLIRETVEPKLWKAFDAAAELWGRDFGYQPFDQAVTHVMQALPEGTMPAEKMRFLKEQLVDAAMPPVLDKLMRLFVHQMMIPGNPSIFVPDWFAQGGNEGFNNMTVQSSPLIRTDWDEKKPALKAFHEEAGKLLNLRKRYPIMDNGVNSVISISDEEGVTGVTWDNGDDYALFLGNTGKPSQPVWGMNDDETYQEILPTQQRKDNFKLDLKEKQLPEGTVFVDPETQDRFVIDNGLLVKEGEHQEGITIEKYRFLLREKA